MSKGVYQPLLSDSDRSNAESAEDKASVISKLFIFFLNDLFKLGTEKELLLEDLGVPCKKDRSRHVYDKFIVHWNAEMEKKKQGKKRQSLWHVLWLTVGYWSLFEAILWYLLYAGSSYGPVLVLSQLVSYFEGSIDLTPLQLWLLAGLMFICPVLSSLFANRSNLVIVHISIEFRNALVNMIFRKSLRLSPAYRQQQSTGKIINMFSNDTNQVQNFLNFANNVAIAPLQIIITLYLIYREVGVATFAGLGYMIIIAPLNSVVFGYLSKIRLKKVAETDKRVKLMNEILSGIRVIKYYAWETAFKKKVEAVRTEEVKYLQRISYVVAIGFSILIFSTPIILPIIIFFTYVQLGNQLDASTAFTTIALFNLLQMPFALLPMGLVSFSQSQVSMRRLNAFFESDELSDYVDKTPPVQSSLNKDGSESEAIVTLTGATLGWSAPVPSSESVPSEGSPIATTSDLESRPSVNRSVNTLTDINLTIRKGQLVAVVGAVGSGKSSLVSAILGNMYLQSGSVAVTGSISYCDQSPWILNSTVEGNILFGSPKVQDRLDRAIKAACLEDDLKILPGGIDTEIGERGINLSGGQKARVSLARAVYLNSDIYILDDPLAAVDAHVGQSIFHGCIKEALAGKTRILITHHIHLLSECDVIVVLEDGMMKACGSYQQLSHSGIDLSAILPSNNGPAPEESEDPEPDCEGDHSSGGPQKFEADEEEEEDIMDPETADDIVVDSYREISVDKTPVLVNPSIPSIRNVSFSEAKKLGASFSDSIIRGASFSDKKRDNALTSSSSQASSPRRRKAAASTPSSPSKPASPPSKKKVDPPSGKQNPTNRGSLITTEERGTGDVSTEVYWYYIKSGSILLCIGFLVFLAGVQGFSLGANFYLTYWGSQSINQDNHGHPMSSAKNIQYMEVFAALSLAGVGCTIVRSLLLAKIQLKASLSLHNRILDRILAAPIAFFDVTPLGRIVNRFSSDMTTVDETISQSISQLTNTLFSVFGALVGIAVATSGTFLIIMLPLAWVYNKIQISFRKTNTAIARLEAVSRSPIYAYFSETLNGVNTIRAYGEEANFISKLESSVDANTSPAVLQWQAGLWLGVRLDFIGALITFFVVAVAIVSDQYLSAVTGDDFISAGYLALGLTYSFTLTISLKFCVRVLAQVEANMNSVERLKFYSEQVEQEGLAGSRTAAVVVPDNWPVQGKVEAKAIQMRYRDGPLILKDVSFNIEAGQKVGIAGRTGSGKSSLMNALFRIQELAGGQMFIGGIDTASVPLQTLRSRIGIVPQDPVLFSATVRFNLDPFDQHTDDEIWSVLESVDLTRHIKSLPNQLLETVVEAGENFSVGQRQLMCIGRALLRQPKILVLDEATASIDNETDDLIQRMVRTVFQGCTVLTIAHRLHTIIDCDKIMVLDGGNLAEFDSPQVLLQKEDGLFRSLWERHQKTHGEM